MLTRGNWRGRQTRDGTNKKHQAKGVVRITGLLHGDGSAGQRAAEACCSGMMMLMMIIVIIVNIY